jgi:hypothetical protein
MSCLVPALLATKDRETKRQPSCSPAMRLGISALNFILGRRLANREYVERKMTAFEGVPAMGFDGLGSSAYGPEAALTVLIPLGAAGLAHIGIVIVPILARWARRMDEFFPVARPEGAGRGGRSLCPNWIAHQRSPIAR